MKPTAQLRQLEQSLWLANIDALAATRQIGEAAEFVAAVGRPDEQDRQPGRGASLVTALPERKTSIGAP